MRTHEVVNQDNMTQTAILCYATMDKIVGGRRHRAQYCSGLATQEKAGCEQRETGHRDDMGSFEVQFLRIYWRQTVKGNPGGYQGL